MSLLSEVSVILAPSVCVEVRMKGTSRGRQRSSGLYSRNRWGAAAADVLSHICTMHTQITPTLEIAVIGIECDVRLWEDFQSGALNDRFSFSCVMLKLRYVARLF